MILQGPSAQCVKVVRYWGNNDNMNINVCLNEYAQSFVLLLFNLHIYLCGYVSQILSLIMLGSQSWADFLNLYQQCLIKT